MDTSLKKIYEIFPSQEKCIDFIESVFWPDGPACPYCKTKNNATEIKGSRHHCNTCNMSFSVTVRTIFHDTKIDLQKWFFVVACLSLTTNKISSRKLAEILDVNKNTAWGMLDKIQTAQRQNDVSLNLVYEHINKIF